MKRAVITGATGAIGTALIEKLTKENVEVLVLTHKGSTRNLKIADNPLVKKAECSLEEFADFQNPSSYEYDTFFHLAWAGTYGSTRNDTAIQTANAEYALDAVRLAKRLGCKCFTGIGSQAEYGRNRNNIATLPEAPCNPESEYGKAKLEAWQNSRELCRSLGLKHIWCRAFSVYGPGDGDYTFIMSTLKKLIQNEPCDLTEGIQKWDFIYNADAARAIYLAACKGIDGSIYNIGSGKVKTLCEYVGIMKDVTLSKSSLNFGAIPYFKNQPMFLCADISSLKHDTGFEVKTSFADGIKMTAESLR